MTTVIFACVHSAGRSQMATAFFNALADPARAHAISAGTEPASQVHPEVVQVMEEIGLDLRDAKPTLLTENLASTSQLLITMGCGESCPVIPGVRRDDWELPDPKGKPLNEVREIRDRIRSRVQTLVEQEGWRVRSGSEKPHVLFLCTHNAARSQIAEMLLRRYAGDRFQVSSAGFEPTDVHPLTRQVLTEVGIDPSSLHAKPTSDFMGKTRIKYAIIVCPREELNCPRIFPFALRTESWPFDDPARYEGPSELQLAAFRRVRNQIDARIRTWLEENRE